MWFWLSLFAILFWSGSDVLSKVGSKPEDIYSHWKMVMAVGGVMGIHALYTILGGAKFSPTDIVTYLPASGLYILSMILGYVGLRYVKLSLSSPVCNSSGAVAALLCFFFLKETMSGVQFFAVALISAGILALSVIENKNEDKARGFIPLVFPLLYCLIDGLGTFVDALLLDTKIGEEAANTAYELTFFGMAVFAFVYVALIKKQPIRLTREKPKLAAAVCETAGQYAYVYALGANAIVAAPLISSYCVASLLWSRIFLKERLTKPQYLSIALAVAGIVILGAFE